MTEIMVERVAKAIRDERRRWVYRVNFLAGEYEALRWKDWEHSNETDVVGLGADPGGVMAKKKFAEIVWKACAEAAIEATKDELILSDKWNPYEVSPDAG